MSNSKFSSEQQEQDWVSKTQLKREAQELQQLGQRLTELTAKQQEQLPLSSSLQAALDEATRIKPRTNAMRRHLSYLGRLLRNSEDQLEAIRYQLEKLTPGSAVQAAITQRLERWRERLITADSQELSEFLTDYPEADIQHLRQLIRNAQKELESEQKGNAKSKLFKYLRDLEVGR